MRRLSWITCILALSTSSIALRAQAIPSEPNAPDSTANIALGYDYTHSNAPPGGTQGFGLNGGFLSAGWNWKYWLGITGEAAITKASDISNLGQNLTLATYTAGPRVTARQHRTLEFAQGTVGIAHGSDSYFPTATSYTTSATSLAFTLGGGLDYELNQRFAIRVIEVQYLHTALPNGVNSSQNQTMFGAGLVFKFAGRAKPVVVAMAPPPHKKMSMSCSANFRSVQPGEPLEVTALTRQPDGDDVTYSWTSDAGTITGNGSIATLDTTGIAPGHYKVTGHASLVSDGSIGSSCEVSFHVVETPKAPPAPPAPAPVQAPAEVEFHMNVRDILFDYDKSILRPDSQQPLADAVTYLQAHPALRILIGGYSDERGSTEYNIALGLKRSTAVRDALVSAGISASRLQIVSYGKGAQVCVALDETCFQRNRRAAFLMQP